MSQFTNDLGRPLSAPCPVGVWGKQCSEDQYKSWRRVAVGLRRTMQAIEWSLATNDLHKTTMGWLHKWIDTSQIDNPVEMGEEMHRAQYEADPHVEQGQRFPSDLAFYQGAYDPVAGWTYNDKTTAIAHYIRQGKVLYDAGIRAHVIKKKATEIVIAEETKPEAVNWLPIAVGTAGVLGVAGFVVWAYTSIVVAMKSGGKRNAK